MDVFENNFKNEDYDSEDNLISETPNKRKNEPETLNSKRFKSTHDDKKNKNHLYKAPTAEELNRLKETECLFNSNIFRLQIEQLLKEINIKPKYKKRFLEWFGKFEGFVNNIPEFGDIKLSEFKTKKVKSDKQRFINNLLENCKCTIKTDQDVLFKFIRPQQIKYFGLHMIDAAIGPNFTVNINVIIPKNCFLEKDYLNNRYLIKQYYYTSYIYTQLKQVNLFDDLNIEKSILTGKLRSCSKIKIQVYFIPADNTFKLSRFEPEKNNVRQNLFNIFEDNLNLEEHGTPYYNSLILHNLRFADNYYYANEMLKDMKNIQEGIQLILVWLKQRSLGSEYGGFSESLLTQTILYLLTKRKINKCMSSYQVIRNFWIYINSSDWHKEPITLCDEVKEEKFKTYLQNYDVVFLDKSGSYNLASFLCLDVYLKIKYEAELAVNFLDNANFNSFTALFMTKMNSELQYDAILILNDNQQFRNIYNLSNDDDKCKYIGCSDLLIIKNTLQVLHKGLSNRISNIVPILQEDDKDTTKFMFGISLEPSNAFTIIEKGPEANTPEATEFRNYWGKLSECRRFADGSIREAVYFPTDSIHGKRKIFKLIINHLIKEKLKTDNHMIISDQFEDVLITKNIKASFPIGTNEEACIHIIEVFDELSKKLRNTKLPLEITTIQGTSDVFSYTAVFPPLPNNYKCNEKCTMIKNNNIVFKQNIEFVDIPYYVEPIEGIIQLSLSSKWPRNLEALRHLKIGFYLALSNYLKESQILSNVNPNYLDVFYKGYIFRLRLYNPRESTELRRDKTPDGATAFKDTCESIEFERNLNILPKIVGALHGLQLQNPSFGPSSALIKKWLRSQLIDEYHIPDLVIDLLNASLYMNCAPYKPPNLPQIQFLRFLKFIQTTDWNLQPVFINFNNEFNRENIDNLENEFQQNRQQFPELCLFTPYDEANSLFSKHCSKEVLKRFTFLAKSTIELIENKILERRLSVQDLFISNLQGYNMLIHLKPYLNSRNFQNVNHNQIMELKYDVNQSSKIPIIGFDSVKCYLTELRKNYGEFALFFHDTYGGNVIGVLWIPSALEKKTFKVSHMEGRKLENNNLILNKTTLIQDFYTLGCDIIETIEDCS